MKLVYVTLLLALIISLITLEIVASRLPVELLRPARIDRPAADTARSGG